MVQIYNTYLDKQEVQRVQKLEFLDEFEEWHLIQGHYFVLLAVSMTPGLQSTYGSVMQV